MAAISKAVNSTHVLAMKQMFWKIQNFSHKITPELLLMAFRYKILVSGDFNKVHKNQFETLDKICVYRNKDFMHWSVMLIKECIRYEFASSFVIMQSRNWVIHLRHSSCPFSFSEKLVISDSDAKRIRSDIKDIAQHVVDSLLPQNHGD